MMCSQLCSRFSSFFQIPSLKRNAIKYKPLNNDLLHPVRLLVVLPGSDEDDIECELHQASLHDKHEPFEALSYTWGDDMCPRPILIDGAQVHVTVNLEAALRCLRYPRKSRTLWVDAVCIYQDDMSEKMVQIKQMGLVYELARRVLVWLGPAADSSDLAMDFAQTLFDIWSKDPSIVVSGHEELASNRIDWVPYADRFCTPRYAPEMVAATKLLMRPWWSRTWVVQEFLSNDNVLFHCGSKSKSLGPIRGLVSFWGYCYGNQRLKDFDDIFLYLNFGRYYQLVNDMMHRRTEVYGGSRPRDEIAATSSSDELSASFLRCLSITRGRGCQYQHDRIYSILGIVGTRFKDSIRVDYNLSLGDLYAQTMKCYIDITGRLDMICHSQPTGVRQTLPTWLPDWNIARRARIYGDESYTHAIPIKAAGASDAKAGVHDNGTLTALGMRIGVLKSVRWEMNPPLSASGIEGPGWWIWGMETAPHFVGPLEEILKRDKDTTKVLLGGERVFAALLDAAHRSPTPAAYLPLDSESELVETWQKWSYLFGSTTWNRTVFTTHEGHIGLGLSTARPGDELCIMLGCRAPVILRKQDDGYYTFIGDSFVHGIMDGEVMTEFDEGKREVTTFKIR